MSPPCNFYWFRIDNKHMNPNGLDILTGLIQTEVLLRNLEFQSELYQTNIEILSRLIDPQEYRRLYLDWYRLTRTYWISPLLAEKDFDQRDYYGLWTDQKQSSTDRNTTHTYTLKGLYNIYSEQIWLVDELQKTAVDCNKGLIHSEQSGINRHQ